MGEKFGDSEGSAMPSVFFSPRKTNTMKRVVVQQYLGYQVVVGVYIMRGCRVRPSTLFVSCCNNGFYEVLVPKGGLEPPRVTSHAPQTCASASSATSARPRHYSQSCVRYEIAKCGWRSRTLNSLRSMAPLQSLRFGGSTLACDALSFET